MFGAAMAFCLHTQYTLLVLSDTIDSAIVSIVQTCCSMIPYSGKFVWENVFAKVLKLAQIAIFTEAFLCFATFLCIARRISYTPYTICRYLDKTIEEALGYIPYHEWQVPLRGHREINRYVHAQKTQRLMFVISLLRPFALSHLL